MVYIEKVEVVIKTVLVILIKPANLVRYSIRKDGFTSVFSECGYIIIDIKDSKSIKINYKTYDNGYIYFEHINKQTEIINLDIRIDGNMIDKIVYLNETINISCGLLKINLYNSEIFTLTLL